MIQVARHKVEPSTDNAHYLTQKLIEGLMLYRNELGELGQCLELLMRCERVLATDRRYLHRVH